MQRAIRALIDANPDGAWLTAELCRHVYGVERVEKLHRVAVIRALKRMKMPRGWFISTQGGRPNEWCLLNGNSAASRIKAIWHYEYSHVSFEVFRRSDFAKEVRRKFGGGR